MEVRRETRPGPPASFVWRGREYTVVEVLAERRLLDLRRPWWTRRHRDEYVVRVDTGELFRLRFHRGPGRPSWTLFCQLPEEP